jgi:sugar phosphate isomerase/epimerase
MNDLYLAPSMLMDVPPLAFLDAARDAGYQGVGLRLQKSPQFPIFPIVGDEPLIRDIESALADSGLKVLDILAFYLLPETDVQDYEPALALGAQLGARYALTQGNDPDWNRLCGTFDRFCIVARKCGLTPIIEFCPNRTLATLGQALELLEQTGHADLPILIDPIHLVRSEGRSADLQNVDPKRFPYAQMSDGVLTAGEPDLQLAKKLGLGERRMPGDGTLPLREIFTALPAGLPISVEVIMDRPPEISPLMWATIALQRTRDFLKGSSAATA